MRHLSLTLVSLALLFPLMAMSFSGGCASSAQPAPTAVQQLTLLENAYAVALHALRDARDDGVLSPAELEQTKPLRDAVSAALDRSDALRSQPSSAELQTAVSAASAALLQFQASSVFVKANQHQRRAPIPTTVPGASPAM